MATRPRKGRATTPARPSASLVPLRPVAGIRVPALQLFRNSALHPAGPGPWQDEPDKISWRDLYSGYPCTILRDPEGHLAGHVAVPSGHPLAGFEPGGLPPGLLAVHGGVTYTGPCQSHMPVSRSLCPVTPLAREADAWNARALAEREIAHDDGEWWLGFACDTSVDLVPGRRYANFLTAENGVTYRDEAYVARQCAQLCMQLYAVEHGLPTPPLMCPPPPLGLEPQRPLRS